MTTKTIKLTAPKVNVSKGVNTVKQTVSDINDFVLETSDELVDRSIKRGSQWQDVSAKAIQGGLKLAANQQDIFFDALETFKTQITKRGKKRMANFFSKN